MPDISVIIPAYNSASTLARAVESCLRNARAIVEVIIVDDCSSDETLSVAFEIAQKYDRIQVVHNDRNGDRLEARRSGLAHARGSWVAFLDADDELESDCLDEALELARSSESDIAVFPIHPRYVDGMAPDYDTQIARIRMYDAPDIIAEGDEIVHAIFRDSLVVWSVVGKLFNRSVILAAFDDIPCEKISQAEDALIMFAAAIHASKLVSSSSLSGYLYYMGIGGTVADRMMTVQQFDSICSCSIAAQGVKTLLDKRGLEDRFGSDYEALRDRLIADPANRFPNQIAFEDRRDAFNCFVDRWSAPIAIAAMARQHWSDPIEAIRSLFGWRGHGDDTGYSHHESLSIALVYHSLGVGGIEELIRYLSKMWLSMGHRVVVLIDHGSPIVDLPDGVDVEYLPNCFTSYAEKYIDRANCLYDALVKHRVDTLVHEQWLGLTLPWDALIARSLGIRCICHANGAFFSAFGYELTDLIRLPLTYGLFDHVISSSESDAEFWANFCHCSSATMNPVNKVYFADPPHSFRGDTVAWCGRVSADKGLDDLFIAAREIVRIIPNAKIKVFGPYDREYVESVTPLLCDYGIDQAIEWCGPKSAEELAREYESVDCFLLSSMMEGWCLSLNEAKAASLPCVMYRLPYLTLCKEGSGVITAPLGDAVSLGRQVVRVLRDGELSRRLSLEAHEHALSIAEYDDVAFWRDVFLGLFEDHVDFESVSARFDSTYMWEGYFDMQVKILTSQHLREENLRRQLDDALAERDALKADFNSKAGVLLRLVRKIQNSLRG